MSRKIWGDSGRNNVTAPPTSGRAVAAWMNFAVCSARYSGELPPRSCSMIVKPEPVPRPGMAGGPKAKPTPAVISRAKSAFRRRTTALAWFSSSGRNSQSLSWMNDIPAFGWSVPLTML